MTDELFREDAYLKQCSAQVVRAAHEGIFVDRTVFYPMGGGQPGDTGMLVRHDGSEIPIVDTRKDPVSGDIMHVPAPGDARPQAGEVVTLHIDWDRRYRLMRMHSCMHMLCAVIPAPVTGGSISDGRGRLDFDLPETLDREQVTAELNRLIESGRPMHTRWITDAELDAQPELVRTMSVQPPRGAGHVRLVEFEGIDLQPCGGTHVANSAEIGRVRVAKIEKKGRQNRRVSIVFD
ncbi:MAG: alanyl-tRNA editing protein [Gammaproteobacteria bacterium]|nr:alanyl-tRNA editing protein [Gammaproteobacteria bacterium]